MEYDFDKQHSSTKRSTLFVALATLPNIHCLVLGDLNPKTETAGPYFLRHPHDISLRPHLGHLSI